MSDAARAAKRRYYHRNRERILRQQAEYRRRKRHDPSLKVRLSENTQRWRRRFKETMRNRGHGGRTGQGLSPEGHRWRDQHGLPVPPWPTILDPRKQRRRGAPGPYTESANQNGHVSPEEREGLATLPKHRARSPQEPQAIQSRIAVAAPPTEGNPS